MGLLFLWILYFSLNSHQSLWVNDSRQKKAVESRREREELSYTDRELFLSYRQRIEENFLKQIKVIYENLTVNIMFTNERPNAFP